MLENLIDNAIRHSPEDGVVRLAAQAGDDGVTICVSDEGRGIPAAKRECIFERNVQLDGDATRTTRGLGLAFCKTATEAHGGKIWVTNANPGTTFCIWLPHP